MHGDGQIGRGMITDDADAQTVKFPAEPPSADGLLVESTSDPTRHLVLTAAAAARLFRVSERTWRAWHAGGQIPEPVQIGRSVFWRPKELVAWVDAGCPDRHTWKVLQE